MTSARRMVSTAVALAATALGGGLPTLTGIAGAQGSTAAQETYRVPPNGVFTFQGHGWGHGHGMSQYGAYGAAKVRGLSYQQIVAFYYPHTTLVGRSRSTIVKVLMHGTTERELVVAPRAKSPMTITTTAAHVSACRLPTTLDGGKSTVTRWRARRVSTAAGHRMLVKGSSDGTTWSRVNPATCDAAWAKPIDGSVTFTSGAVTNLVRSGGLAPYRGSLRAAFTGTRVFVVNVVRLESYLRSVVPSEMPSSWSAAALQAQAVAARTYASYEIEHPKNKPYYDVYDDTRDQMYVGVRGEAAASTAAVQATQNPSADTAMVLQDSAGHAAFTQFSSSDGGWTVSGGQPYLPAHRDPYDGLVPSSVHSWTSTIAASSLSSAFGGQIGTVRSIVVTDRDGHGQWGGRVTSLTLHGTDGNVSLSGSAFRYDFGLRSEWFRVLLPPTRPTVVTAAVAHGTASVSWQPPPAVGGHAGVTGYRIVLQPSGATRTVAAGVRSASLGSVTSGFRTRATVTALSSAGPGQGTTVTSKVHRLAAGNRVATAVAVSRATFAAGKAGAVVLARRATTTGL
ncbi:MAG: stage sporulation protein, partial [Frankiaceae bacterium]|nr:stage sporulation protein [Frankiaceae bacterium]